MATHTPTCFISYAREHAAHTEWVFHLATKLRKNGIDSKLDRWDCPPGYDLARFMISGVKDSDYVVLVCTPTYREKAERNIGGVGDEGTIIFGQLLLQSAAETKFIPILRAGNPAEALPAYLSTRLFIDFRRDAEFESSADQLIRHLHGLPLYFKPPLGHYAPSQHVHVYDAARKWILVAGTGNTDVIAQDLESTASGLGAELARNNFGLITGGWPGVDRATVGAFSTAISTRAPLENFLVQVIPKRRNPGYSVGRIVTVPDGDREYSELIKIAEAAVLIGGLGGTLLTGLWMRHLGKPVLPLASTGGDAGEFHRIASQSWVQSLLPNASLHDFAALADPAPGVVENAIRLLNLWAGAA